MDGGGLCVRCCLALCAPNQLSTIVTNPITIIHKRPRALTVSASDPPPLYSRTPPSTSNLLRRSPGNPHAPLPTTLPPGRPLPPLTAGEVPQVLRAVGLRRRVALHLGAHVGLHHARLGAALGQRAGLEEVGPGGAKEPWRNAHRVSWGLGCRGLGDRLSFVG